MITSSAHAVPHTHPAFSDGITHPFDHLPDFRAFASLRRMVTHQQGKPLLTRSDFVKQLTLHLPEVAARIEEGDFGIVHLEVGAMKLATGEALAHSDLACVRRHLSIVADMFERADAELYDAIRISYLEALFLDEVSAAHIVARGMLSRAMENALRQTELHLEKRRSALK